MQMFRLQFQLTLPIPHDNICNAQIANINFVVSDIMITFAYRITISNLHLHGHCFASQTVS